MNERKECLRPLTTAYIPAYTKERLTSHLNSSTCIGQIKLIFILMYFAQPNKNNNV